MGQSVNPGFPWGWPARHPVLRAPSCSPEDGKKQCGWLGCSEVDVGCPGLTRVQDVQLRGWLGVSAQQTKAIFICIVITSCRNPGCPPAVTLGPFVLVNRTLILCYKVSGSTERVLIHLSRGNLILLCLDVRRDGPRSYSQTVEHKRTSTGGLLEESIPQNKERSIKKWLLGSYCRLPCLGCVV